MSASNDQQRPHESHSDAASNSRDLQGSQPAPQAAALSRPSAPAEASGSSTIAQGTSNSKTKTARNPLACQTCRRQKMRCTGGNPCERCIRGGHDCRYEPTPRTRKVVANLAASRSARPRPAEGDQSTEAGTSAGLGGEAAPSQDQELQQFWSPTDQLNPLDASSAGPYLFGALMAQGDSTASSPSSPNASFAASREPVQALARPLNTAPGVPMPNDNLTANSAFEPATYPYAQNFNGFNLDAVPTQSQQPSYTSQALRESHNAPQGHRALASADAPFFLNPALRRMDELESMSTLERTGSWVAKGAADGRAPQSAGSNDIVAKGIVASEADALEYWDHFHKFCASRVGWSSDVTSFAVARRESQLLLAATCSVAARSLGRHDEAGRCVQEALEFARQLVLYSDLRRSPADYLDMKGLLVLCVEWAMPDLMPQIVSIAYSMSLQNVFAKLTDPAIRGASDEASLIEKGRMWLLITIHAHLHSLFYKQPSILASDFELVRRQCGVLRSSSKSSASVDACLACHAHLLALLARVQEEWPESGQPSEESWQHVDGYLSELEVWWNFWSYQGEGSPFSKKDIEYFLVAYQMAQLAICAISYSPLQDGAFIAARQKRLTYARRAMICAMAVIGAASDRDLRARSPTEGLVIEFALTGLGYALSNVLGLAFSLPGAFDLTEIRETISHILKRLSTPSLYADLTVKILSRFDVLMAASRSAAEPLSPQRLDVDLLGAIQRIGADPTFYRYIAYESAVPQVSGWSAAQG